MTPSAQRPYIILLALNFLITFGFGAGDAMFPLFFKSIESSALLFGIAVALYSIAKIVCSPVMEKVAVRYGIEKLLLLCLLLYLFSGALFLVTTNSVVICCLRLVQGIGCAMFRPVADTLLARRCTGSRRATHMAAYDLSFYLAVGMGPCVGGLLVDLGGYPAVWSLLCGCSCAATLLAVGLLRALPGTQVNTRQYRHPSANPKALQGTPTAELYGIYSFIFVRGFCISSFLTFFPLMMSESLGFSSTNIGLVLSVATLGTVVFLLPMSRLANHIHYSTLIGTSGSLGAAMYLLTPHLADLTAALLLSLVLGCASALSQPALRLQLSTLASRQPTIPVFGLFYTSLHGGLCLGPLVSSLIHYLSGLQPVFVTLAALQILAAALPLFAAGRASRVAPPLIDCDGHKGLLPSGH